MLDDADKLAQKSWMSRDPNLQDWHDRLEVAGCKPKWRGDKIVALCPAHRDTNPSLSVAKGNKVPVVAMCHAGCTFKSIRSTLGFDGGTPKRRYTAKPKRNKQEEAANRERSVWFAELPNGEMTSRGEKLYVVDTYIYEIAYQNMLGAVLRLRREDGSKTFRQAIYNEETSPRGKPWRWGAMSVPRPLYNLVNMLEWEDRDIWVVEGEKSVHKITHILEQKQTVIEDWPIVVCWAGGANAWHKTNWNPVRKRVVYLLPDCDDPGRLAMQGVAKHIDKIAQEVRYVNYEEGLDGQGWDDIMDAHGFKHTLAYIQENYVTEWLQKKPSQVAIAKTMDLGGFKHVFSIWETRKSKAFMDALEMEGLELRFNLRSMKREIREDKGMWKEVKGTRHVEHLRQFIAENYGWRGTVGSGKIKPLSFYTQEFYTMLEAHDFATETDTFMDWLLALPKWDKVSRISGIFSELFTEHPSPMALPLDHDYVKWSGRFLFLAPVQLTMNPETNDANDRVHLRPLLVGPKWIGKSAMLQVMFPKENPDWFSSSFTICSEDAKMVQSIVGRVMVEVGELNGLSSSTMDKWKQFSTRNTDHVRLSYRRDSEIFPRRCVLIGTTNSFRPLPFDAAGWRRDLPIILGPAKGAVEPYIRENRLQLWAEAVHLFDHGERVLFPVNERKAMLDYVRQFQIRNDLFAEAINNLPLTFTHKLIGDLLVESGMCMSKTQAYKLPRNQLESFKSALLESGCEYVKWRNSKSGRWYYGWNRKSVD